MQEILSHPAVHGGVAPFLAAVLAAILLHRIQLGGLAPAAAFATTVYLLAGFAPVALDPTQKLVLVALGAFGAGVLADFAFKPTRIGEALLALAGGGACAWMLWPELQRLDPAQAWLLGGVGSVSVAWMVASGIRLAAQPMRAGAAALALGAGAGSIALLGGSGTLASYGFAIGLGAVALLLVQAASGRTCAAGATLALGTTVAAGLVAASAQFLAGIPWTAVPVLALIPLAAYLPVPATAPLWLQAVLLSLYGLVPAGLASFLAWPTAPGTPV